MNPYTQHEIEHIESVAHQNSEQFRYEAGQANTDFNKRERSQLRRIRTPETLYLRYHDTYLPISKELHRKKTFENIKKSLTKELLLSETDADNQARQLIVARHDQLVSDISALLPRRARKQVVHILQQSTEESTTLLEHYKQARLYRDVATRLSIVIYDPYEGFFRRHLTEWRIRRSRRQRHRNETKRITAIERQLEAIDQQVGPLLKRIVANDLNVIDIFALRNSYEKKKTTNTRRSFEQLQKLTKTYVDTQLDTYYSHNPDISLQDIGTRQRAIEKILQDVLKLDNKARNQLLLTVSDYKKLYDEKMSLLNAQNERAVYTNRSFLR